MRPRSGAAFTLASACSSSLLEGRRHAVAELGEIGADRLEFGAP